MDDFRRITEDDIPCWMKLGWKADPATISILVHQDMISELDSIPTDSMAVEVLSRYGVFSAASADHWGFNNALRRSAETPDGFISFDAVIPRMKKILDTPCDHCDGTGKDEDRSDEKCLNCEGVGRPYIYEWDVINSLSASITLLTEAIGRFPPKKDTSTETPQLLTIQTSTENDNFGVWGEYSAVLVDWFRDIGPQSLVEPAQAMQAVLNQLAGTTDEVDPFRTFARIESSSGHVNIGCPGDACSLSPNSNARMRLLSGYEFSCHNADGPFHQFPLLAALAAIEMQARKELGL
jgi:hypothetical protein